MKVLVLGTMTSVQDWLPLLGGYAAAVSWIGWPHAESRSWLAAQLAMAGGYTIMLSMFLPDFWRHSFGPLSKNCRCRL
ncbi:DoxX-like family protein [Duganella callida]|uniref:Uncharacterized protein n=1 Tax=Duganella callida TaxID=2561932 RepID=A0A4Y9STH9_9BURK|nr:DoxX-like family protein [Duganella callida]TFW28056.1 hypothetical protein E4L98_05985 [Duganella callida]